MLLYLPYVFNGRGKLLSFLDEIFEKLKKLS